MNHDRLWAPWRLAYVKGELPELDRPVPEPAKWLDGADGECFLCRAAALPGTADSDRLALVIERTADVVVLLNRFPYSNAHLLVSPRRHQADLGSLTADEQLALMQSIAHWTQVLPRAIRAEGINVGLNLGSVSGAGVPGHLHWHIVPRWSGDHNFISTTAGTRVLPQSLEAAWELLTTFNTSTNS